VALPVAVVVLVRVAVGVFVRVAVAVGVEEVPVGVDKVPVGVDEVGVRVAVGLDVPGVAVRVAVGVRVAVAVAVAVPVAVAEGVAVRVLDAVAVAVGRVPVGVGTVGDGWAQVIVSSGRLAAVEFSRLANRFVVWDVDSGSRRSQPKLADGAARHASTSATMPGPDHA
jgi:hypothetical protein